MDKGISPIIISVILLIITVALAGGFFIWGQGAQEAFKDSTEEQVDNEIQSINSGIGIINIQIVGSRTDIALKNIGSTTLDTSKFNVFIDGALISIASKTPNNPFLGTEESIVIRVNTNARCKEVRITGQHDTVDIYDSAEWDC